VSKSRSRSSKPRGSASRAKSAKKSGAKKGAKKSTARAKKPSGSRTVAYQTPDDALDVKQLKSNLQLAIQRLNVRIEKGELTKGLAQTRDAFSRWTMEIDNVVCTGTGDGPCGNDMFIGS
jgi:hypothetical protein